jgi:pimeloyl-ACP methyl ester carboxylesterase
VAAVSKSCLDAAERDKLFRFTTSDGATLVGVALGRGSSGLVLGHQLGSDLCEWLPQARMLAKRAYRVLAFDFAGFGDSPHGPADSRVDTDVVAAAADDHPFLEHARELRDAARVRDKRLLVIPGGGHGTSLLEFGEDASRVRAAVQGFVAEQTRH